MKRLVVGTVVSRLAILISIDTEHTEVTSLTRPHPVVCVASELTQGVGGCEDQSDITVYLIYTNIICIAPIETLHLTVHTRVSLLIITLYGIADTVYIVLVQYARLNCWVGTVDTVKCLHNTGATLFSALQETYKESFCRTLLSIGMSHKAIGKDIILGSRELLDGSITAMMIGEHQSVGTDHYTGTEVTKVHHSIL